MWLRWVLAIAVAAAVIVAIVLTVQRAGPENSNEEAVEGETNRIADLAITEDEAPRTASLTARATPTAALARAIGEDVRRRISNGRQAGRCERGPGALQLPGAQRRDQLHVPGRRRSGRQAPDVVQGRSQRGRQGRARSPYQPALQGLSRTAGAGAGRTLDRMLNDGSYCVSAEGCAAQP
jgi:negative regulator of sigma E activity